MDDRDITESSSMERRSRRRTQAQAQGQTQTPDETGTHQSPASKAFAERVAKYAYTGVGSSSSSGEPSVAVGTPCRSGTNASQIGVRRNRRDGDASTSASEARSRSSRSTARGIKRPPEDLEEVKVEDMESEGTMGAHETKKRKLDLEEKGKGKGKGKTKPKPRGYAPPETYQHLRPVNDLLRDGLDIVFCGINPGKRSSTMGHHFSHPTNKFWRSLFHSGLTSRLLDPTEDHLMSQDYDYGLTNLVDRPTSEQSELSTLEMRLNVYRLTLKFLKYRPRVVCFVGKRIWDVYESVVGKTAVPSVSTAELDHRFGEGTDNGPAPGRASISAKGASASLHTIVKLEYEESEPHKNEPSPPLSLSLSPMPVSPNPNPSPKPSTKTESASSLKNTPRSRSRMTQTSSSLDTSNDYRKSTRTKPKPKPKTPFDPTQPRRFRLPHDDGAYTYFWVVPNTSGLERTQLPEQIINFGALRAFLTGLKEGRTPERQGGEDGYGWADIVPPGVEGTVRELERAVRNG